jgi:peptide-methionine (R)-S-oxide reductase
MHDRRTFLTMTGLGALGAALASCGGSEAEAAGRFPVTKTDAEWKKQLGDRAYAVLRHEATERPYSSPLNDEHRAGTFACKGCDNALYSSKTKFESGTGWPSFWAPLPHAIGKSVDHKMLLARTEIHCARCGGHLGHVFNDGPEPTGKRYCMNGVAMVFHPAAA